MAKKSILLVTVDCLRADHVGFMGYPRPTTPFLDSLAKESFIFPAAIVAGAPTYYSLPAMLASRYPLALGRDVLGLSPNEPTLSTVLKEAGYATAAFIAGNPYISPRFGYERGFDRFQDFLDDDHVSIDSPSPHTSDPDVRPNGFASRFNRKLQELRPRFGPLGVVYGELYFQYCQWVSPAAPSLDALRRFPAADVIVEEACRWLECVGDAPFFLWLHLMDPHAPYYPKNEALALTGLGRLSPFRARYLNSCWNRSDLGPRRLVGYRDAVIELYDAGIRWADRQLACLAEKLRRLQKWEQCIFALTADHGEEFLDHGGRFHPPSQPMEELIHVPLLLRVPEAGKRDLPKTPFSLLHLAPTLLEASNVPIPKDFRGTSFWRHVCDRRDYDAVAISECVAGCTNPFHPENRLGPRVLSVRESRYKLVLRLDPQLDPERRESLYDLEADSGEQAPLSQAMQKPVRRRLLEVAREHLRLGLDRRDEKARLETRLRELRLEWKLPEDESSPHKVAPVAS